MLERGESEERVYRQVRTKMLKATCATNGAAADDCDVRVDSGMEGTIGKERASVGVVVKCG